MEIYGQNMTATELTARQAEREAESQYRHDAQKFIDLAAAFQLLAIKIAFTLSDHDMSVIVTMGNDKNQMLRFMVDGSPVARIFADRTFHPRSVIQPQALSAIAPYHVWTTYLDHMLQGPPVDSPMDQRLDPHYRPPLRFDTKITPIPYKKGGPYG